MDNQLKLLLIDGNNMSNRVFWSHRELQYKGSYTGVLFGFFKQLIYLRKKYPDYYMIVAWDAGYARRKAESQAAVAAGIVPSAYKEQREKARAEADDKKKEELETLFFQMNQLRDELIPLVRCTQVFMKGFEGDDILYSYCKYVQKWNGKAIIVSSDHDFYQTLGPNVTIFDAMKDEFWSEERFQMEFAFPPSLFVDYGALVGEVGPSKDNIFGVDGWGPKTAGEYIRAYGCIENIVEAIKAKPKKKSKEEVLLASEKRWKLARSLKQMDEIPNLPRPRCDARSHDALYQKFMEYGFMSLLKDVRLLV